jgi:Lrp/AsnC family leucine-responsive transcriptional regulator
LRAGIVMSIDDLDRKILEHYQRDIRTAAATIGEAVGLSAAAVQRRLKRMRDTGVIIADVTHVAPKAVGLAVTCVVAVDLDHERGAQIDAFAKKMRACPEVQQCYYVTGEADFILIVLASSVEAYDTFTRRMLLSDPNVKSFKTYVALERVKVGLDVPIAVASLEPQNSR